MKPVLGVIAKLCADYPGRQAGEVEAAVCEVYRSARAFPLPDVITRIELLARARLEARALARPP